MAILINDDDIATLEERVEAQLITALISAPGDNLPILQVKRVGYKQRNTYHLCEIDIMDPTTNTILVIVQQQWEEIRYQKNGKQSKSHEQIIPTLVTALEKELNYKVVTYL